MLNTDDKDKIEEYINDWINIKVGEFKLAKEEEKKK